MDTTESLPPRREAQRAARPRPRLRLLYSTTAGIVEARRHTLTIGQNPLGRVREEPSGIALEEDIHVSRHHAVIHIDETDLAASVEDAGSKNGTYLNGQRIDRRTDMHDGDILRIGESWFLLRYEATAAKSGGESPELAALVGVSPAMIELRAQVSRAAGDGNPVLILGETGTGKELVARALHGLSKRSGDLICVNCAAVPAELAESLFFGTRPGAFTGAVHRPGYFRAAHQGTLFLDELGELPLLPQAKLLRAIDQQEIQSVGEQQAIPCSVRIVAATLRDLTSDIRAGRFRMDLYARLSFTVIRIPPLRERREDLLLLLRHTLRQRPDAAPELNPELVDLLLFHPWFYNVRELQQIAHHLQQSGADEELYARLRENAALSAAPNAPEPIDPAPLAPPASRAETPRRTRPNEAPTPTASELRALLTVHRGRILHIAQALNCSRRHVDRLIEKYGIALTTYRSGGADSDEP